MNEVKIVPISDLKPNPKNPRIIKDDKFKKLVKSLQDFPQMLEVRPIVVDEEGVVLGGNMRLKAAKEAGLVTVPVIQVDFDEKQKKEFVVKDNANFGDWDWEILQQEWDLEEIGDWGVDVFELPEELDYSILEELNGDEEMISSLEEKQGGTKAICIPFNKDIYDAAIDLIKKTMRRENVDLGSVIYEAVKNVK